MEVGCNDDSCGTQSKLNLMLTGGQTYYIRIAGFDGDTGSYLINVTRYLQEPVNDKCADATEVFLDTPYYGTTIGVKGTSTSSCSGNDKLDVWHYFTPSQTGYHTVSLCGSSFNTTLAVYDGCNGVELACNDNMCDTQSEVVVYLTTGQTYLIRTAGVSQKTGDYVIFVSERFIQPPNDDCNNAIEVFEGVTYDGDNIGALGDTGCSCGYFFDFYDVWHSFTPAQTKDYLISLCGSDFDTTLSVYDGCMGMELACNDDSCEEQSALVLSLVMGQTYLIRVAGYRGAIGSYTIVVSTDCMFVSEPAYPYPDNLSLDIERDPVLAWNNGAAILQNSNQASPIMKGIYGTDDRLDEYQVLDSQLKAIGDSTVALISIDDLTDNNDGTYTIASTTLAETYLAKYGRSLCPNEPFVDQPSVAACTGFLVALDIIATTGHCISDQSVCSGRAFVFGFAMINASTPVLTFDASDIYFCNEVFARRQTADSNWALIR